MYLADEIRKVSFFPSYTYVCIICNDSDDHLRHMFHIICVDSVFY